MMLLSQSFRLPVANLPSRHPVIVFLHFASFVVGTDCLLISIEPIALSLMIGLFVMLLGKSLWLPMTDLSSGNSEVVLFHFAAVVVRTHSLFVSVKSVVLRVVLLCKLFVAQRYFFRELLHVIVLRHRVRVSIIVIRLLSHEPFEFGWETPVTLLELVHFVVLRYSVGIKVVIILFLTVELHKITILHYILVVILLNLIFEVFVLCLVMLIEI